MSQPVHSVLSPHRQRMALIIASIVAQFALYVVVLVQFTQYFVYFYWICVGVSLAVSLFIIPLLYWFIYRKKEGGRKAAGNKQMTTTD